jgi:hypothetical protein
MNYEIMGRGRLFDLFGDFVVFRSMKPVDPRIPPVADVLHELGLPSGRPPRKREPGYGKAAVWLLERMHELVHPEKEVSELLFVGDTAGDLRAFREIRDAGGWDGAIFLGHDEAGGLRQEEEDVWKGSWSEVSRWVERIRENGLEVDDRTVAVVDIDKTAIGARGRNHTAIDKARKDAMKIVISRALGRNFDPEAFSLAYDEVNRRYYHVITEDNQDYIAYTCLVMSSGIVSLQAIREAIGESRVGSFRDFFEMVDAAMNRNLPDGLRKIHREVAESLEANDPTPFRAFRREELLQTLARMDMLPWDTSMEKLLQEEICITGELWETGKALKEQGVLLTSFSDKPDEASVASGGAPEGVVSVHRAEAKVVVARL